jgi:hypothetical protein
MPLCCEERTPREPRTTASGVLLRDLEHPTDCDAPARDQILACARSLIVPPSRHQTRPTWVTSAVRLSTATARGKYRSAITARAPRSQYPSLDDRRGLCPFLRPAGQALDGRAGGCLPQALSAQIRLARRRLRQIPAAALRGRPQLGHVVAHLDGLRYIGCPLRWAILRPLESGHR